MRLPVLLAALSVAAPGVASPQQTKKEQQLVQMDPLPFPTTSPGGSPLTIEAIEARVKEFDSKVGGFPPRLRGEEERRSTYQQWSRVVLAAERLERDGACSERLVSALAALYRQGHNMDVEECGARASATIEAGLKAYPDSVSVNWQAAYFYLQIDPRHAPDGEKALLKLRELLGTSENLEIERGLVFAYLYQLKEPETRKQIDRCLQLSPDDEMLLKFKQALHDGKIVLRRSAEARGE